MKDWTEYAFKNNLVVQKLGKCQLCSSNTNHGVSECLEMAARVTNQIEHPLGILHGTIFLSVDAHALQHSEVHGRWNNHFHLSRLNLILRGKISWNYKMSPILSSVLDSYKMDKESEFIHPPEIGQRGRWTVTDIAQTTTDADYIKSVWKWASDVFDSYSKGHPIAFAVSDLFREKMG